MIDAYHLTKFLHLFSMVLWFSGMIGLFRTFALHSEYKNNSGAAEVLTRIAEWRYQMLATPGMIGTWVFGIGMIVLNPSIMKGGGWLHAKILLVFLLSGFMGFVGKTRKRYASGDAFLDPAKCNMMNTLVLVMLLGILALAVLRPF